LRTPAIVRIIMELLPTAGLVSIFKLNRYFPALYTDNIAIGKWRRFTVVPGWEHLLKNAYNVYLSDIVVPYRPKARMLRIGKYVGATAELIKIHHTQRTVWTREAYVHGSGCHCTPGAPCQTRLALVVNATVTLRNWIAQRTGACSASRYNEVVRQFQAQYEGTPNGQGQYPMGMMRVQIDIISAHRGELAPCSKKCVDADNKRERIYEYVYTPEVNKHLVSGSEYKVAAGMAPTYNFWWAHSTADGGKRLMVQPVWKKLETWRKKTRDMDWREADSFRHATLLDVPVSVGIERYRIPYDYIWGRTAWTAAGVRCVYTIERFQTAVRHYDFHEDSCTLLDIQDH